MKIRAVLLAMMTLMLSAGSLMAMDSEYQEKRRQALQEKSASASIQADNSIEQRLSREVSRHGEGQHRGVHDEEKLTREALRHWWN